MTDRPTLTQHYAVLAQETVQLPPEARPQPGPVALLPQHDDTFAAAVHAAGGQVAPLSGDTRALVWLSSQHPQQLDDVLTANPQIGWVQLPWAGVDAFSAVIARHAAGRVWTSAKGAYAQPVAEHALMLTLSLLRRIPTRVRATSWSTVPEGRSLYGLNVVVVGAGGISIELVRLLQPFGAHVTVVRRTAQPFPGAHTTLQTAALRDVLPDADVVVLAAAMTEDTRGLIDREELAMMKSTAVLVNIARGGMVDTDALVEALATGRIEAAGLDVTDPEPLPDGHPLWSEPRALITPHSADTPEMTAPLLAERLRLNVAAFLTDGRFVGVVDPVVGY